MHGEWMKRQYLFWALVSALVILAFIPGSIAGGLMASFSQFPNIVSGREASVDLNPMITRRNATIPLRTPRR